VEKLLIVRYRHKIKRRYVRADAALATSEVYEFAGGIPVKFTGMSGWKPRLIIFRGL
jgi:hypothetical protein